MTRKSLLTAIVTSVIFLILFSSISLATETRVLSMGGISPFIRDNSNVFYFPATINQYSNQAIAELRLKQGSGDNSIGIHLPIMSGAVLGVYLNQPFDVPSNYTQITPNLELKNSITAIYGTKMSNFDVGVLIAMASDSWENSTTKPKVEESARILNIGAGISSPIYDLGVMLNLPSVSHNADPAEQKYGGMGLDVYGRYFMKRSEKFELIPVARLGFGSTSYEDDSGVAEVPKGEVDYSKLNLELSVGLNYQMNSDNIALLGLELFGLAQNSEEVKNGYKNTSTTRTLPALFVGIESTLKPWLIGRLGATQSYYKSTTKYEPKEGEDSESSSTDSSFNLSFGFGVKVSGFMLDAYFNENLFFDGPNFISGQGNSIAHRISVTYNF